MFGFVGVVLHNHLVIPPTVPLAWTEEVMYAAEDLPLC
jgi:hypothetical protein